jgi:hypothetical protein
VRSESAGLGMLTSLGVFGVGAGFATEKTKGFASRKTGAKSFRIRIDMCVTMGASHSEVEPYRGQQSTRAKVEDEDEY